LAALDPEELAPAEQHRAFLPEPRRIGHKEEKIYYFFAPMPAVFLDLAEFPDFY
jgi:hypothetical protein